MGMSSLVVTVTTWGMMGKVRTSVEPRVVSSVTNCSPSSTLSSLSGYIAAWGDCNSITNLSSEEMLHGRLNLLKQIWTQWTLRNRFVQGNERNIYHGRRGVGNYREEVNKSKDIFYIFLSGENYAFPISAATIQMKSRKSTICTRFHNWDII